VFQLAFATLADPVRRSAVEAHGQAAAYIAKHTISFAAYLRLWSTEHAQVLEWFQRRLMQYPESVATTWQVTFNVLSSSARNPGSPTSSKEQVARSAVGRRKPRRTSIQNSSLFGNDRPVKPGDGLVLQQAVPNVSLGERRLRPRKTVSVRDELCCDRQLGRSVVAEL
jgi:hypothetical protein